MADAWQQGRVNTRPDQAVETAGTRLRSGPARQGHPWTFQEYQELIQRLDDGLTDDQIAEEHQRTVGGIQAAVNRLLPDATGDPRACATETLRGMLAAGFDWQAAAAAALPRGRKPAGPRSFEADVARYAKERAKLEARLLEAVSDARAAGTDPELIASVLRRVDPPSQQPPAETTKTCPVCRMLNRRT